MNLISKGKIIMDSTLYTELISFFANKTTDLEILHGIAAVCLKLNSNNSTEQDALYFLKNTINDLQKKIENSSDKNINLRMVHSLKYTYMVIINDKLKPKEDSELYISLIEGFANKNTDLEMYHAISRICIEMHDKNPSDIPYDVLHYMKYKLDIYLKKIENQSDEYLLSINISRDYLSNVCLKMIREKIGGHKNS